MRRPVILIILSVLFGNYFIYAYSGVNQNNNPLLLLESVSDTLAFSAGGTKLDNSRRVIKKIQKLMGAYFPDTPITVSDNGEITYK
jgi:hypothetical protein